MSVTIPQDVQQHMNALLETGRYGSEEELLRAAVTALELQNVDLAVIQSGVNDMENKRYRLFTEFDGDLPDK